MTEPREGFLNLAKTCGAKLTGKPDGSEAVTVVFTVDAWRAFDAACLTQALATAEPVADPANPGWCIGCNPDNCIGCGMGLDNATTEPVHPDDHAVDRFAVAMKAKLAASRAKGRGGWDDPGQCTVEHLARLLVDHVAKGDPVDVANFAMMLHQRGADRSVLSAATAEPKPCTTCSGMGYVDGVGDACTKCNGDGDTSERKGEPVGEVLWEKRFGCAAGQLFEPLPIGTKLYTSPQVPEDVQRDAERYRWLRDKGRYNDFRVEQEKPGWVTTHSAVSLDAAIDAARKEQT